MIHKLSHATTYLETYIIDFTGKHILRSYASGFFMRTEKSLFLVTNWHVITGLNPIVVEKIENDKMPPSYLKLTSFSKEQKLINLILPLYDELMNPLWKEHSSGNEIDLALYQLPLTLEKHFEFVDISSATDNIPIAEKVAEEVFVLGYPFNRAEMIESFGNEAPYYLPVWKRGSIATEPSLRLGGKVILIDSLSRPGMSGSPIVIAQDNHRLTIKNEKNINLFNDMKEEKITSLEFISKIDPSSLGETHIKNFRFLGVYSGVIGNTRLKEVALGKCWHADILQEILNNPIQGKMPAWHPARNEHYEIFLKQNKPILNILNKEKEILNVVQLTSSKKENYSIKYKGYLYEK